MGKVVNVSAGKMTSGGRPEAVPPAGSRRWGLQASPWGLPSGFERAQSSRREALDAHQAGRARPSRRARRRPAPARRPMIFFEGTHRRQLDGSPLASENCTPTSGANGLRASSGGRLDKSGGELPALLPKGKETDAKP